MKKLSIVFLLAMFVMPLAAMAAETSQPAVTAEASFSNSLVQNRRHRHHRRYYRRHHHRHHRR